MPDGETHQRFCSALRSLGWPQRHLEAWDAPRGPEVPLKMLIVAWAAYAEAHQERFTASVGDDGVLGPEWVQIGKSLLELLNGDLGRFDGSTLDAEIREIARRQGVDLDE